LISNENKWVQSNDRLARLKLTLWCFDAISRMRNSLDQSMKSIEHAKAEIMRQMKHVSCYSQRRAIRDAYFY